MTLHVALTHRTAYHYDRTIGMAPQVIRLRPAPHCRTPILSYSLTIEPAQHFINWQQDAFANYNARVVVPEKTDRFIVTVGVVADMAVINPFDFFLEECAREWPFAYAPDLKLELQPYLEPATPGPGLAAFLAALDRSPRGTVDFLCDLNRRLHGLVGYRTRLEPGIQAPDETLQLGSGSCRDSAWLLVEILRNLGFAARFVSGYLIQLRPDLEPDGGAERDLTDLHAWAEVYVPGAGWIGLDATSGLLAGEGHIPLAATPQPSSAAPISGGHEPAEVTFTVDMVLERIRETPRVTLPYSEEQWRDLLAAGDAVDQRLHGGDVRLSMGGEPTFVSESDRESAEWKTAAIGPTKRRYADDLVRRLHTRFAPGGLLHYGQGKWYPGEALPRWALSIYWRRDGRPLWARPELIAREDAPPQASIADARRLTEALSVRLGFTPDSALPAYEDAAYYALVEQKLPPDLSPGEAGLADTAERARLVRIIDQGIDRPVAYILPVQSWHTPGTPRRWMTERWSTRREKLFLTPGDAPAGQRLPLPSLASVPPVHFPHILPRDPFSDSAPLPEREALIERGRGIMLEAPPTPPLSGRSEVYATVRAALVVEPRDGRLCVFLPQIADALDFAALIAAIEEAAAATGLTVHIEGHAPPADPRLDVIRVTPDPGVVEVNIHAAADWRSLVGITTTVYEEARAAGLSAEKFLYDGRHIGTGGGNHIVMGGMTPADSPFIRRPDLLASMVTYWQNHPSLSYLFSGLFVGATSQAPRIDEARDESLYELEIALKQLPEPGTQVPPWLVDRLFRHLLVDVTGNTHRAEICVDKLYSPDSPTGRLGLVELRAFEMPPHARMSVAEQLLIRALIAMFWETPYRGRPVRWGTALQDRFMLPHFVWADFAEVAADIRAAGLPMSLDWFRPHCEFRFPRIGSVSAAGLELELRQALEPWYVLGEEAGPGGTARYVDASLERIEARLRGQTGSRYVATCNGRALPLTSTGTLGEQVAGVRFRTFLPSACLHPTITPHVPLTFDIIDTWNGRSLGGCRYHATHPGGRSYTLSPINAKEAQARRLARFEETGHSPGPCPFAAPEINPEYPLTLDLRR